MQVVFWVMFIVIGAVAGFFFYEFEKSQEKIFQLESDLYELKHMKSRTETVLIRDEYERYKKGGNPYTVLANIGNIVNKKELDSDQTEI